MVESCLRSVLVYGRCAQSLLELLFTGMKVESFCNVSSSISKKVEVVI